MRTVKAQSKPPLVMKVAGGGTRTFEDDALNRCILRAISELDQENAKELNPRIVADRVVANSGGKDAKYHGLITDQALVILDKLFGFDNMTPDEVEYHLAKLTENNA